MKCSAIPLYRKMTNDKNTPKGCQHIWEYTKNSVLSKYPEQTFIMIFFFNYLYTFWQKHDILKLSNRKTRKRGIQFSYFCFSSHPTNLWTYVWKSFVNGGSLNNSRHYYIIIYYYKEHFSDYPFILSRPSKYRVPVISLTGHWNLDPRITSTGRFWVLTYEHQEITYIVIRFVSISAKIWHLHRRGSIWDTCLC